MLIDVFLSDGPAGAASPSSPALPTMYTEVPWSEAQEMRKKAEDPTSSPIAPPTSSKPYIGTPGSVGHNLLNKNAGICKFIDISI